MSNDNQLVLVLPYTIRITDTDWKWVIGNGDNPGYAHRSIVECARVVQNKVDRCHQADQPIRISIRQTSGDLAEFAGRKKVATIRVLRKHQWDFYHDADKLLDEPYEATQTINDAFDTYFTSRLVSIITGILTDAEGATTNRVPLTHDKIYEWDNNSVEEINNDLPRIMRELFRQYEQYDDGKVSYCLHELQKLVEEASKVNPYLRAVERLGTGEWHMRTDGIIPTAIVEGVGSRPLDTPNDA